SLAGCGGGGGAGGGGTGGGGQGHDSGNGGQQAQLIDRSVTSYAVIKVRTRPSGSTASASSASTGSWIALAEKPQRMIDTRATAPDRKLLLSGGAEYLPPSGWSLIDAALHASGQVTAVLVGERDIRLVRLDAQGTVLRTDTLADPAALTDPYYGDPLQLRDPAAMHPYATRDTARLAAVGDDIVLVLRTGRNAVIAYRLSQPAQAAAALAQRWRTVVEPGTTIGNVWLTGGSYDPFGDLQHNWQVFMDVDASGRVAVAVPLNRTELSIDHAAHFHEPMPETFSGSLVTVLAADGQRQTATLVDPVKKSQLSTVRWLGDDEVAVAGRILTTVKDDGTGWDGYVARVRPSTRSVAPLATIDTGSGDHIFDLARLPDGRLLAAGVAGYWQNPAGASISEGAAPLLALLGAEGQFQRRLAFAGGARHNQLRSVAPWGARWLVGGMADGPGTHTGDADDSLIRANGVLREVAAE
ncbi:hypothetical protein E4L96_15180, partial [Massilia arenosa]